MANRTVTVTVASGTLYVVGGTGNSFYIDGARPGDFTVDWVKDGTIRFEQSGASNAGHPLIFSTSNSSTLATMQAGIISSGVTYYLDGASNQAAYTNTTTFNAATTRYIEIAPASQTDFYFACWIHGISMGGIMDITQNTWGASTWSTGGWEAQPDFTVQVTGQALTLSQGEETVTGIINEGWGRLTWGENVWDDYGDVILSGGSLSTAIASVTVTTEINTGWGRLTWGENVWDDFGDVILTGGSLATGIGSVTVSGEINAGWGRGTWGNRGWGIQGDTILTGQSLSFLQGTLSVTTDVTQGWGRQTWDQGVWGKPGTVVDTGSFALAAQMGKGWGEKAWDTDVWGGITITVTAGATVIPTALELTTSLGNEGVQADVVVSATAQSTLNISTGTLSMAFGVPVTGQVLTTGLGRGWGSSTWDSGVWGGVVEVSLSPVISVTGQVLTPAIGTETVSGDANVTLTGNPIGATLGTETISIGQQVSLGAWGDGTWGHDLWGNSGFEVGTNLASVTATAEINIGWGRQTWGYGQWGDAGIVVGLTGQAMALALGNESTQIDVAVTAATQSLTVSLGTEVAGASAEAPVTGQVITSSLGTLSGTVWTEINPDVSMVWTEIAA